MDHIKTQIDRLSELSDEEVAELQNSVVAEFEAVEQADLSPESVDAMSTYADMLDTVRSEVQRREAQAEELSTRAAEASARVKGAAAVADETKDETPVEEEVVPEEEAPVEEEKDPMSEASIVADESSEASTETAEAVETPTEFAAEEAATSEVVEEAEAAVQEPEAEAAVEAEPEAEAAIEEEVPVEAEAEAAVEEEAASEEAPETEASAEVSTEAEASNTEETPDAQNAQEEAPVTAAADEAFEAPADRRPVVQATVAPVAITAGADIPGYTAGSTIQNMKEVSVAMEKRIHSLRRVNGGDGEQHIVASVTTTFPDEFTLTTGDAEENSTKIAKATSPEALMASGGFATPIQARYDIFGFGSDERPVRDSLPRFQADRGGIRFVTPPVLSSYAGAVGVWTNDMDVTAASNDGTGDTIKNSLVVTGATEQTEMTYAVTLQLQIGNLLSRAYPELIARHNELALIQHARIAEQTLLSKIDSKSTQVTAAGVLGFARDFLVQVKRAGAAYRNRHRISVTTPLQAIIPSWVYDAIAADLTMQMPGDDALGTTKSNIDSYLATSNVKLTASPDQALFPAQGAGALTPFPASFEWYLFSEGSFLFLDGGSLDLGIIRDSGLVGTNDYKMFVETFEGLAFVGIESLAITSTIAVTGEAAALTETAAANNPA